MSKRQRDSDGDTEEEEHANDDKPEVLVFYNIEFTAMLDYIDQKIKKMKGFHSLQLLHSYYLSRL